MLQLAVRVLPLALGLIGGDLGLREPRGLLAERIFGDGFVGVQIHVGVVDPLRFVQARLRVGHGGIGVDPLRRGRRPAVAQAGLRAVLLIGEGRVEIEFRLFEIGLGLHDAGLILRRQHGVGFGRRRCPTGRGFIGRPGTGFAAEHLRIFELDQDLAGFDTIAGVDGHARDVAGDERRECLGVRTLDDPRLGQSGQEMRVDDGIDLDFDRVGFGAIQSESAERCEENHDRDDGHGLSRR